MSKISLVGWFNEKNAGDEYFKEVFSHYLSGHELSFSQIPDTAADAVIFGGGGVLVNQYLKSLPLDIPTYAIGIDINLCGPNWDKVKGSNFKKIFCRSREYAWIARTQGLDVQYCPDLAFGLPLKPAELKGRIGVILNSDLSGGAEENLQRAISGLSYGNELVFIPMYSGVVEPDKNILLKMPYGRYIETNGEPEKVISAISACDLIISMRFHGIIFATMLGIPSIGISNKGKMSCFFEQENLHSFIELRDLTEYKILVTIDNLKKSYDSIRRELLGISDNNYSIVKDIFGSLL